MKKIIKNAEPPLLVQHRANQPAFYIGLPAETKEALRQSLLSEQGHICCYCMRRIPEKVTDDGDVTYKVKIEHYQCQDKYPLAQLTYTNLYGACTGNEGKPKKMQTCDTKKANDDISINLLTNTPNCESLFKYNAEGEISSISDDEAINHQLNEILNLNMQTLKDARREIYLEVQAHVEMESKQINGNDLKIKYFQREKQKWIAKSDNKYKQFCMVAVYYLSKKIKQA